MKRLMILSAVLILCGVGILVVLSRGNNRATSNPTQLAEPDAAYLTRGRIMMLPSSQSISAELQIHHEPIDSFVNANGTVGMPSMIMPFPLDRESSLAGLAVGDAVEFEFAVWTRPGSRDYQARKLRKLPANTELNLPR